ncbi:MAG: hypothetical protein WCG05_04700 [Alphaproteobacteria bacterium]
MQIYFAWAGVGEEFDFLLHSREDEDVLAFRLSHKEGEFPVLEVEVPFVKTYDSDCHHKVFLSCPKGLLFTGHVEGMPVRQEGDSRWLTFVAKRSDWADQVDRGIEGLKKLPQWEPLLVAQEDHKNLVEVLKNFTVEPHWDRRTGELTFSDLFIGRQNLDLGDEFFADSLKVSGSEGLCARVNMSAKVQWVQRYEGLVDLSGAFGERGMISTLTPSFLKQSWWQKGHFLRNSGYAILKSGLKEVRAVEMGGLGIFPQRSVDFETPEGTKNLPRMWFTPTLIFHWKYRQKRQEILELSLSLATTEKGQEKDFSVQLENISFDEPVPLWRPHEWHVPKSQVLREGILYECKQLHESGDQFDNNLWTDKGVVPCALEDPASATFFLTARGEKAVDALIERARAHVISSLQTVRVYLEMPFEDAVDLTCDTVVSVKDDRLPGGCVQGKVKEYGFVGQGDGGNFYAYMTLGVVPENLKDVGMIVGSGIGSQVSS